ncbi:aromatic ring-hydroxylating dioxygenase subunit alpha [Kribbella sp. NPDC050124]|uniref:aromatic ring-hydroxylating dioxygenase subunit alpha n=1 Tax=Kribbella sp. NPDC050124 TaxID=3364114 RepID=UPI00378DA52F
MNFATEPPATSPADHSGHADIAALVERRAVGYSLEGPLYTSREVYDLDLGVIFGKHWLFVAAEAELAEPGDYVTVDIGPHSVIVVRDDDEQVRALRNVCRHRGARILQDPCGAVGNLVCPYHQWTYRTDGSLIFAEGQSRDFDKSQFGLKSVNVRTVGGLIFVCLADEPPADFDEVAAVIEPYLAPYRLQDAKVAHQTDLVEGGNWKLVMENNRECQHCDASHPELIDAYFPFGPAVPLVRSSEEGIAARLRPVFERYLAAGDQLNSACSVVKIPRAAHRELDTRVSGYQLTHLPLQGDGASFGPAGAQLSRKLMGDLTVSAFGDMSLHLQPNSWFHLLSDHAVVFTVLPVAPDQTLVRTTWLVHADAVEGVDYDVESLTATWRATNDQDRVLVEMAQRGAADPGYEPGPYGLIEDDVEALINWYIGRLRAHFGLGGRQLNMLTQASGQ